MNILSLFRRRPPRFEPGQRYRYATRPGEEQSRVVVLRVDPHERLGPILHIAIENVDITPPFGTVRLTRIAHVPLSLAALQASEPKLDGVTKEVPEYEDGYGQWRAAFDAGQAGIFTIPVAEIVAVMETTIARGTAEH